jgi:hypothetical protein
MKFLINPQKYAVYLFCFSLNFETLNLFNIGIDFLASKISISILLAVSMVQYKSLFTFKNYYRYLIPILIYFGLLTTISFIKRTTAFNVFFDFPLFLNILIFLILINYSTIRPDILLKGLFVFALSTVFISILYFFGIESVTVLQGIPRHSIFGGNSNDVGVKLCYSIFILASIVFENKLELGKHRYYLLIFLPLLIKFMIDTNSRVAFVSFVLGCYVMFRLYYNSALLSRKTNLLISGFILFLVAFMILLINVDLIKRLFDIFSKGDLSGRDWIWSKIRPIISTNLVFGVGETGYAKMVALTFGGFGSPHNVILEVLCYTGLVGLLFFLVFLWRVIKAAYIKYKYQNDILPIILLIPILGMILSAQILWPKIVWLIFAFIVSQNIKENSLDKKAS